MRLDTRPAAGMVSNQDKKMVLKVDHCVPLKPWISPTPAIDPVTVCVVETGMPKSVAAKMIAAAPVSAAHPLTY